MKPLFLLLWLGVTCFAQARPNVLLILTDDQGFGDLSLHGNPHVQTPTLDRFAKAGIQFERFFVSPLCAPTRASLLTGRYHLRSGVWGVTFGRETLRAAEVTLAEALKPAGYRTGLFGKWHNGEQYPYTPPGQGFDEFFGFHNGHWNLYFDTPLLRGAQFVKTKGFITDVLTDEAMRFIEKNQAQPFFCYVPFNAPHGPYQVPDKYFDKYKARGLDDTTATIYGMVENIDDNVARLLAQLEQLKLRDHTIVIFITDNGPQTDRFNSGMRGRKGSVHEGGVRVPFFLQYPARFKTPQTVKQIAAHIDVMPTLLELCGVKAPAGVTFDGRSLVPLLAGQASEWPDRMLYSHNNGPRPVTMYPGAARNQRYRLVNEGRGYELYDLQEDPAQKRNLAADQPDLVQQMSRAYEAWFQDVSRAGFARFPIQLGHARENPLIAYAPQADFTGLQFFGRNGYAHDWLSGWTDTAFAASWQFDVVSAGTYEIALRYQCADAAGSLIEASLGGHKLTARTVTTAHLPAIKMPDRVVRNEVNERHWAQLQFGKVKLSQGAATLTVRVMEIKGKSALELKAVTLRKL
jgi:arylsulfatase A